MMSKETYNMISKMIIGAAIDVHRELGPGLLESVYESCLEEELNLSGLRVEKQVPLPIIYKGKRLEKDFRIDLLVENEIILELKSIEEIRNIHEVQLLTYLKLSGKKRGLLINFNVPQLIQGIKRKVNGEL